MFRPTAIACTLLASLLTAPSAVAQSGPADDSIGPTFTVYGSVVANTTANTTQLFIPDIPIWAVTARRGCSHPPSADKQYPTAWPPPTLATST